MKKLVFGTIFLGLASLGYSQNSDCGKDAIELTGVEVGPVNHAYLDNLGDGVISPSVFILEKRASRYNVKESPFYSII